MEPRVMDSSVGPAVDAGLLEPASGVPGLIGLETLPLDIIVLVVALLDIQDIYRLRQVRNLLSV